VSVSELHARVVERVAAAENAQDPALLLQAAAVDDAFALLRAAAPGPDAQIDLDALFAVCAMFWSRLSGSASGPEGQRDWSIVLATYSLLSLWIPDKTVFPGQLREMAEEDPTNGDARFAFLMGGVHAMFALQTPDLTLAERLAALDAALAWTEALQRFPAEDDARLDGDVQLMSQRACRFVMAADIDSLATAGRIAVTAFPRLSPDNPMRAALFAETLEIIIRAATLLGDPSLADVERFVRAAGEDKLTPDAVTTLGLLRGLHEEPVTWPGELDARAGVVIADLGFRQEDTGLLLCAVQRLRPALANTPTDHPAHAYVAELLGRTLVALGLERDDDAAVQEGNDILATLSTDDEQDAATADVQELLALLHGADIDAMTTLAPVLDRVLAHAGAVPPDVRIAVAVLDMCTATFATKSNGVTAEQIDRYRTALGGLLADHPGRYAYVAVLAAATGVAAATVRDTDQRAAAELLAEAGRLTEEVAASAPADFTPLDLLRRGRYFEARTVALLMIPPLDGDTDDDPLFAELRQLPANLSAVMRQDLGVEPNELAALMFLGGVPNLATDEDVRRLEADVARVRALLDRMSPDSPFAEAGVVDVGFAMAAIGIRKGDPAPVKEAVDLLRRAHGRTPDPSQPVTRALAKILTVSAQLRTDPDAVHEATALLAGLEPEETDADRAFEATMNEAMTAIQSYLQNHDVRQREHARGLALRLGELAGEVSAWARNRLSAPEVYADTMLDLVDSLGPGGGAKLDVTDAEVDRCRQTLAKCPVDHPFRGFALATLVRMLLQRSVALRGTDPERAAALAAEANEVTGELGGGPASLNTVLQGFVRAISEGRWENFAASATLPMPESSLQAIELLLTNPGFDAADPAAVRARLHDPLLPVWVRAHAGLAAAAGALRLDAQSVELALSYAEDAVELMAQVTDRGSDQQSAEHGLTTFDGDIRHIVELVLVATLTRRLAGDIGRAAAAVAAIEKGEQPEAPLPDFAKIVSGAEVERAVAVLESGRGLLLARQLEARVDLSELRSPHPHLAAAFERLTEHLAADPDTLSALRPQDNPPVTGRVEWALMVKSRASRELDAVIARIRDQPGFGDFLPPLSAERLRGLAANGPVVVLNHGSGYSHAIVVTDTATTALMLDVESAEVTTAANRLRDAIDAINARGRNRPSPARLIQASDEVSETLSWTWHKIVRPVLDLAGVAAPDGDGWPRIWWVPTGPFNALPLHAAQCSLPDCEQDGCGSALDRVVSSYVPGLQTLAHARARSRAGDLHRALLVAAPEDDLPGVAAAAEFAAHRLGAPAPLVGAGATRTAVLRSLADATWVHFGCHATSDLTEPSSGVLHLPSGQSLSVLDICRARPGAAKLAFLAACGTARGSDRLADEAIHITSAFLIAGFPEAVGTLWEIDSGHAEHVTRAFYRRTTETDADTPALALHHTVRELRNRLADQPHQWAAYVHAGI
jgi:CHAT domain-containing protein